MSVSVSPTLKRWTLVAGLAVMVLACNDDDYGTGPTDDPNNAPKASIDRFSDAAGTLFKRSVTPTLPAANAPIDMDVAPFITQGLGPDGRVVRYYNFDVMPEDPAPIYLLAWKGGARRRNSIPSPASRIARRASRAVRPTPLVSPAHRVVA